MVWTSLNAKVLREIFIELDKEKIPWMIMRNYEGLPYENDSKDIDIAIPRKLWKKSREIIYHVVKTNEFTKVIYTKFQSISCHTFYKFSEKDIYSFKIDIFGCYEWRGAEYISFEKLYADSKLYNGMHIPNEKMNAVMLFLKPLILGGDIKEKYRPIFEPTFDNENQGIKRIICDILGEGLGNIIWNLYKSKNYEEIKKLCHCIRIYIWKTSFFARPLKTVLDMISHYYTECKRRIFTHENGMIAVLGSDGVGKTTFINNLKKLLIEYIPLDDDLIKEYHFRPCVFPNIKKLLLGKRFDVENEKFEEPHREAPSGRTASLVRMIYYWLDYIIGIPIIFAKARINNYYVIFDRYFHDFLVDPYRSRINLNYYIRYFLYKLVKKPLISFVLLTKPTIIYQRKKELELEEIERQTYEYMKLIDEEKIIKIDASGNSIDMAKFAFRLIIDRRGTEI